MDGGAYEREPEAKVVSRALGGKQVGAAQSAPRIGQGP